MICSTHLAWLAAVIEAEGSITFQATRKKKDKHLVITPIVRIPNNDDGINNEILRVCNEKGIQASAFSKKNGVTETKIDGMLSVKVLLEQIQRYLRSSKSENAKVVMAFIKSRIEKSPGKFQYHPYTLKELQLVDSIRTHSLAIALEEMMKCPNVVLDE